MAAMHQVLFPIKNSIKSKSKKGINKHKQIKDSCYLIFKNISWQVADTNSKFKIIWFNIFIKINRM